MQEGRITLLLDALNEIPYRNTEVIQLWKDFLADLETLVVLPASSSLAASLDYSSPVVFERSAGVPQVRIESLSDDKVRQFLQKYSPNLWRDLME